MTQPEFGAALGKGRDTIANYELARAVPDDTFLELLALKYHYRAEWIRTGELPKKLPEPEGDEIARIALDAARLSEEEIRRQLHAIIDRLPPAQLKLITAAWLDEEFRKAFPP